MSDDDLIDCRLCGGTGKMPKPCPECLGSGYVIKSVAWENTIGDQHSHMTFGGVTQTNEPCPRGCRAPLAFNNFPLAASSGGPVTRKDSDDDA